MKNALIWRNGDRAVVALIERLPRRLTWDGVHYYPRQQYFSDVDYLRDAGGELVGFSYFVDGTEPVLGSPFFKSTNIIHDHLTVQIILKEAEKSLIENVQAVGTQIYESATDIILVVPDWGFGKIGFTWQDTHPSEDQ